MDLKTLFCLLLIPFLFIAPSLQAAELAGRVWFDDNKRPADGVRIVVTCARQVINCTSDRYGFYRCPGLPAKNSCVAVLYAGNRQSEQLLFYSGQGRETQNFGLRVQGNQLIVRKH